MILFTLHSATIKTCSSLLTFFISLTFTLHSATIKTKKRKTIEEVINHLHYTLLLLKPSQTILLYIIEEFTLHSATIKTDL